MEHFFFFCISLLFCPFLYFPHSLSLSSCLTFSLSLFLSIFYFRIVSFSLPFLFSYCLFYFVFFSLALSFFSFFTFISSFSLSLFLTSSLSFFSLFTKLLFFLPQFLFSATLCLVKSNYVQFIKENHIVKSNSIKTMIKSIFKNWFHEKIWL